MPPSEQLGKFWCDSLVHDAAALDLLTEVIGKVSYRIVSYRIVSTTAPGPAVRSSFPPSGRPVRV